MPWNSSAHPEDMLHKTCDWRPLFPRRILEEARSGNMLAHVKKVGYSWQGQKFQISLLPGKVVVVFGSAPESYNDSWEGVSMRCTCGQDRCVHMAAALFFWEKLHGPWVVWESRREYEARKAEEARERILQERKQLAQRVGNEPVPAMDAFRNRHQSGPILFDIEKALSSFTTTPYYIARMKEVLQKKPSYNSYVNVNTSRDGRKSMEFRQQFEDEVTAELVWGSLEGGELDLCRDLRAKTGRYYFSFSMPRNEREENEPLDEFELTAVSRIWDAADEASRADVTDVNAQAFFKWILHQRQQNNQKEIRSAETAPVKEAVIELLPRIVAEDGNLYLSFKIGRSGARKYVVKDCFRLIRAVEEASQFPLGKKETLDFSLQEFTPDALRLFEFIQRHTAPAYGGLYQLALQYSELDDLYDMYLGGQCELMDKTNGIRDELVRIGHMDIHFPLIADRLSDARGTFLGVTVSGFVPVLIYGSAHEYVLDRKGLSRICAEERRALEPFLVVSDAAGYFRFQVGVDHLQEFYYRALPGLLENPYVDFIDHCSEEAASYLPPEPRFSFYLDLDEAEKDVSLTCRIHYAEREERLCLEQPGKPRTDPWMDTQLARMGIPWKSESPTPSQSKESVIDAVRRGDYRDREQEQRVLDAVRKWFPVVSGDGTVFSHPADDDYLYDLLTSGISSLEFYGTVNGSAAFRPLKVISRPAVQVGISVSDGNLLDISVTSKDFSASELQALYESYTRKKRYYRLKSGDFVDLTQTDQFSQMDALLQQMDLRAGDVLKENAHIPMYRALYLNQMLEKHETLVTTRDRTYRALIRSFKTILEADVEIPAQMESILRPYQAYGYKWLKTLQFAGFGGILADEMGLGKTVQMIAVFESDRLAGNGGCSLVVCPASLVYNWQEEIHRFAPKLTNMVVAGTAEVRKKVLASVRDGGSCSSGDVLITSYDLLKRDIALYEGIVFENCVLDEAQFIKNSGAAVSKAVKVLSAKHRFVLTGTPIENRLSELWSIFDFLMPGFLYSHPEFENRFERPIAKEHNAQQTEILKNMTSPFILRRKKAEVLADLPDKLEEVRFARISGEQQKIYDAQVLRMKGMLSSPITGGEEKIRIFAELTRIRQICCDPSLLFEDYGGESAKREACLELIRSAIEGGHRMLVFSQFVTMLELLEKDLDKEKIPYYIITGATPKEKRTSLVRSFNESEEVPVFLISLKAGGTGLNLTGADVVIHYDPWWNLAVQNQATDRAHRIGQTRAVTVYKLILKDTIEERIMELQNAKADLAEAILEGEGRSLMSLSSEELLALLG